MYNHLLLATSLNTADGHASAVHLSFDESAFACCASLLPRSMSISHMVEDCVLVAVLDEIFLELGPTVGNENF